MENQALINGLKDLTSFFESHPNLRAPYQIKLDGEAPCAVFFWTNSSDDLVEFAKEVGGRLEKSVDHSFFRLTTKRDTFVLEALAYRDRVCKQVQVGTRIEPEHIIAAREEEIVPEKTVPIYEWHCPSIFKSEAEEYAEANQ